jgi:hypothetical protein
MKIEKVTVFGFDAALRGMRNSRFSWDKSDSCLHPQRHPEDGYFIGSNDLALCKKLIKAGPEHRKFLRQIMIWADLTLPRYIWAELDTYKFIVRNSCSSIHLKNQLTFTDFEDGDVELGTLAKLNVLLFINKDIERFKNRLPEAYLQKSTIMMNYETALNIYHQRLNHKLKQWKTICEWIKGLPYMKEFLA